MSGIGPDRERIEKNKTTMKKLIFITQDYSGLGFAKLEGDFVKKPGVQMVAKIAKALGVPIEELIK
jgi:hypothetical protein